MRGGSLAPVWVTVLRAGSARLRAALAVCDSIRPMQEKEDSDNTFRRTIPEDWHGVFGEDPSSSKKLKTGAGEYTGSQEPKSRYPGLHQHEECMDYGCGDPTCAAIKEGRNPEEAVLTSEADDDFSKADILLPTGGADPLPSVDEGAAPNAWRSKNKRQKKKEQKERQKANLEANPNYYKDEGKRLVSISKTPQYYSFVEHKQGELWPWCELCNCWHDDHHEEGNRHQYRLAWVDDGWDWIYGRYEADIHHNKKDWKWKPNGLCSSSLTATEWLGSDEGEAKEKEEDEDEVLLNVKDPAEPVLSMKEVKDLWDAGRWYKFDIVDYLQKVSPKKLLNKWQITGSVESAMKRGISVDICLGMVDEIDKLRGAKSSSSSHNDVADPTDMPLGFGEIVAKAAAAGSTCALLRSGADEMVDAC